MYRIEQEERLDVVCQVNAECVGFDCNGDYVYHVSSRNYMVYNIPCEDE